MGAIIGRLSFDREEVLARSVLDRMLDASARASETRRLVAAPRIPLGSRGALRAAAEPLEYAVLVKAA